MKFSSFFPINGIVQLSILVFNFNLNIDPMQNLFFTNALQKFLPVLFAVLFSLQELSAQERINPPGGVPVIPTPATIPDNKKPPLKPVLPPSPCGTVATVRDASDNVYNTVAIGTQCWMKENLRTVKFKNGEPIREFVAGDDVAGSTATVSMQMRSTPAIGLRTAAQVEEAVSNFGRLYNIRAVLNPRGLCPEGWHIPSRLEIESLVNFLGGPEVAGGKLKSIEVSTNSWRFPNTGATNSSGFTALPGGYARSLEDGYCCVAWYWTNVTSPTESTRYLYLQLSSDNASARYSYSFPGEFGSVRCIKD